MNKSKPLVGHPTINNWLAREFPNHKLSFCASTQRWVLKVSQPIMDDSSWFVNVILGTGISPWSCLLNAYSAWRKDADQNLAKDDHHG